MFLALTRADESNVAAVLMWDKLGHPGQSEIIETQRSQEWYVVHLKEI